MKNMQQPEYHRSNLIDFQRKNIWMNEVKSSQSGKVFPIVQIAFSVLLIAALFVALTIWGAV